MSSSWWVLAPSQGGGLFASLKLTPEKLESSVRRRAIPWAPGLRLSGQNGPQQAQSFSALMKGGQGRMFQWRESCFRNEKKQVTSSRSSKPSERQHLVGLPFIPSFHKQDVPLDIKMGQGRKKRGNLIPTRASCSFTQLNESKSW